MTRDDVVEARLELGFLGVHILKLYQDGVIPRDIMDNVLNIDNILKKELADIDAKILTKIYNKQEEL